MPSRDESQNLSSVILYGSDQEYGTLPFKKQQSPVHDHIAFKTTSIDLKSKKATQSKVNTQPDLDNIFPNQKTYPDVKMPKSQFCYSNVSLAMGENTQTCTSGKKDNSLEILQSKRIYTNTSVTQELSNKLKNLREDCANNDMIKTQTELVTL